MDNGIKLKAREGVVGGKKQYTKEEDLCIEAAYKEGKNAKGVWAAMHAAGFPRSYYSVSYRISYLQGKVGKNAKPMVPPGQPAVEAEAPAAEQ